MKNLKIGLGLLTILVGAASSAFKPAQRFLDRAYFAPQENAFGIGSTTSSTDGSQYPTWVSATAPVSSGSTPIVGECQTASGKFCAAQFTVTSVNKKVKLNNTIVSVVTGQYIYEL